MSDTNYQVNLCKGAIVLVLYHNLLGACHFTFLYLIFHLIQVCISL